MDLDAQGPPGMDSSTVKRDQHGDLSQNDVTITVVVPTFNSAEHIAACLSSARRCLPGAQIIVVDNGSTDRTREIVRETFVDVELLTGHGNVGFGRACNLGADHATHEYVLYLNPDAELVVIDMQLLVSASQSRPFGLLAAFLKEGDSPPRPTLRRHSGHWFMEFVAVHLLAMLSQVAPRPRYVERAAGPGTYTVGGAVFLVDVEEFRSLGGFDENFFMYYEDTDLTQRYLQRGYPLRSSPALLASHLGGASAPAPRRNALSFLGWLEYVDKWHGPAAAARCAAIARVVYAGLLAGLRLAGRTTGNNRIRDKADQVSAMLSSIATEGFDPGSTEPHARYSAAGPITVSKFHTYKLHDAGAAS
jgi:N-acetylglucosaminyl-diphospho-decaprenol L-rhamnosyltransferase